MLTQLQPLTAPARCGLATRRFAIIYGLLLFCQISLLAGAGSPTLAADTQPSNPLKIVRITPSGEDVPPGRQIIFEFNQPVVPLGRMERDASEIPIAMEPAVRCQWRWLNPSTLGCLLDEKNAMAPATRYRVTVRPQLKALDGATMPAEVSHSFVTQRPGVSSNWFKTWLAPGTPQIGIRFNQPVEEGSVAAHLFFRTAKGARVPCVLSDDPDSVKSSDYRKGLVWLVTPKQELPAGQTARLVAEPGIRSLEGPEPSAKEIAVVDVNPFPPFTFIGIQCETKEGKQITIREAGAPSSPAQQQCNPEREISLVFSSPVLKEAIQPNLEIQPKLTTRAGEGDPWEDVYSYSQIDSSRDKDEVYPAPLPTVFKPYQQYQLKAPAGAIKDEFNRPLKGGIDMAFKTSHLPPDFFVFKQMSALEKGLDSEAPLAVTNLNKMEVDFTTFTAQGIASSQKSTIETPKTVDTPTVIPLGVRKLLPKDSGVVTGKLIPTPPAPNRGPTDGWFFAQVTPFAVHAKLGHFNTVVWITDMQTGQPVSGVTVQICSDTLAGFSGGRQVHSEATTDGDGLAMLAGTDRVDPELKLLWSYEPDEPRLFVRCQKAGDLAVLPLTYEFRVDAEGANQEYIPDWVRQRFGHIRSWGVTAQGIYKLGDTVQYKIYVRNQNNERFVAPPGIGDNSPDSYTLKVIDPMDRVVYERKGIHLSPFGACNGEFPLARNGAVGWHRFELSASFTNETWEPVRVLVSDFTPSPFKVTSDLDGKLFAVGDTVRVTTQATLHAGGPYANAAVRINATIAASPFTPQDPKLKNFEFDVLEPSEEGTPAAQTIYQTDGALNEKGALETAFKVVETPVLYGRLSVESAVRDDRGKFAAARTTADYVGRDRYVGLLQENWVLEQGKPARLKVAVLDPNGTPVAAVPVAIKVEREQNTASRVKEAGDAFVTRYESEWVEVEGRQLSSALEPIEFEFTPGQPGAYRITAQISDSQDRPHATSIERWAVGSGHVLWETTPGNLLNVYAEKESYQVGETAKFLAQNPYPGARALITVERYGVLHSWVKTFSNSTEIIEVPVQPDYLPGFYLSVLVMSPRVEKPAENDHEDLGKPCFAMGYAQTLVEDPYKQVQLQIKPDRETYKPGDTVTVDIQAGPRHPVENAPRTPLELAVTVLDEAVLDLLAQGSKGFDPYLGFYSLDPLDLANFNLIMQLIGRQKLETKGASPGGGGGPDLSMRSVFKFVSYWDPSIPLDDEGKARIQFQLPDNLTGWRVLALAVSPDDLMGLGDANFKANQSTEIRPALPNQVTAGDRFDAGFVILNRTDQDRTLDVVLQAEGPIQVSGEASADVQPMVKSTQQVVLQPYQRTTLRLPVVTAKAGEIVFTVRAGDQEDQDSLRAILSVQRKLAPLTVAAHGSTTAARATEAVLFPADVQPDSGAMAVTLAPTLIGGLEGPFEYLRHYPYGCWEQKLTVGVAAALYNKLQPYLADSFSWPQSKRLPAETLAVAAEYQAMGGGMTFYVPKDEYASPYLSAFTALAFSWLRRDGIAPPRQVEARLHEYLNSLLRRDAAVDFYTDAMLATVRAVALAALADSGKLSQADVERYAAHLPKMSLFGKAMYLQALTRFPKTAQLQQKVLQDILAHADQTSGTLTFNESLDLRFKTLLSSPLRSNCAVLSALLRYRQQHPDDAGLRDMIANLAKTIGQSRKSRDHWPSTQESVFALRALADYSQAAEAEQPNMALRVALDSTPLGEAQFTAFKDAPRVLDYAVRTEDLGRRATVAIERVGEGRLYYSTAIRCTPAQLPREAINAGVEVHREYSVERDGKWVLLKDPAEIQGGDLVRVDLFVLLPAARYFLVVNDPVPGGLEPVNQQLATASSVDAQKAGAGFANGSFGNQFKDWLGADSSIWSFYHKELRHNAALFYSEYLPPGRYHLSYVAQAVAPGEFMALPTHAEQMYEPDVFGKGVPTVFKVSGRD